jgi:hypothetical protein
MPIINTLKYEASHGKSPKGKGLWGFEICFSDGDGRYSSETAWAHGTLPQARKAVWNQIKSTIGGAKQIIEVTVLP